MPDLPERFGASLRQQQLALCEEWRKAHLNPPPATLEPWEKEVTEFTGSQSLSGDAWARLQNWYKAQGD